eukprot:g1928.t1
MRAAYIVNVLFFVVVGTVRGHVKLRYSYDNAGPNWPIRNAPSAQADGAFSTSGPCGGNAAWGANGFATISNGATLDLRISYNGGHQSNNNAFHLAFHCDDEANLGQDIFRSGAHTVNKAGCTAIAATDSRVNPPYTVGCELDRVQDLSSEVSCTISVMDQREWGGCYDVRITPDTPPAAGAGSDSKLNQMYLVSDTVTTTPSGTECCSFQTASIDVGSESGTQVSVSAGGTTNCAGLSEWASTFTLTKDEFSYTNGASGTRYYNDAVTVGNESFGFNLINSVLTQTNQGTAQPVMCDHVFSASDSSACAGDLCLPSFFAFGEPCSSNDGALGGTIVAILAVLVFGGALVATGFSEMIDSKLEQSPLLHAAFRFLQGFLALIAFAAYASSDGTDVGSCADPSAFLIATGVLIWLYTWTVMFVHLVEACGCASISGIAGYGACSGVLIRFAWAIDLFFCLFALIACCAAAYQNPETEETKGAVAAMFFCLIFLVIGVVGPVRGAIFGDSKPSSSAAKSTTSHGAFQA